MPESLYFQYASIQKKLYDDILDLLSLKSIAPSSILDLGCATGEMTQKLALLFPEARVIGIDKSHERIKYATKKFPSQKNLQFQEMDIERLSLIGPFDLIISNASLQWVSNFERIWPTIESLKTPQTGHFHIQLFGNKTYQELQEGLSTIFKYPFDITANQFPNIETLKKIKSPGTKLHQKKIIKRYNRIEDLLSEIKKTGTRGPQKTKKIWVKSDINQLEKWFIDKFGQVSVTYETLIMSTLS